MNFNPIEKIEDWEMRIARQSAIWENEILDRPVLVARTLKTYAKPKPHKLIKEHKQRWFDVDFAVEMALWEAENFDYIGDALPIVNPNLGPDVFASFYGGEITFEQTTSYITPFLSKLEEFDNCQFSQKGEYAQTLNRLYSELSQAGQGKFYVGVTDLHPGADCLAGLRGSENLCLDMYDKPELVKKALKRVTDDFIKHYKEVSDFLLAQKNIFTSWPGISSDRKWYPVSNDFSYMIGTEQFDDFFLEGIKRECDSLDAALYHLDGIGALTHLDSLLEIDSLNIIQWVYGAGHGGVKDWLDVYKKIQAKNKGIQIWAQIDEIDIIVENLNPKGVHIQLCDVPDAESAKFALKKIEQWR